MAVNKERKHIRRMEELLPSLSCKKPAAEEGLASGVVIGVEEVLTIENCLSREFFRAFTQDYEIFLSHINKTLYKLLKVRRIKPIICEKLLHFFM
jgi:hypothetical protein